jgi:hypothetical protein
MVKISDIVSTLLKGLTIARIKADQFSAAASTEYLDDPNLQSYPVPRFEIRSADFDLKLSVIETVRRNVDALAVMLVVLSEDLPAYVDDVLSIPVKALSTDPPQSYRPLREHLGSHAEAVRSELITGFESHFAANAQVTYDEIIDFPNRFGSRTVRDKTFSLVASALASRQITVWLGDNTYTKAVAAKATAWGELVHDHVVLAVEMAQAEFFELDLAVKKDQLLDVPAHVISGFKVSFMVENYEWTVTRDSQGNPVRKLTRK